ncbi:MAG: hypothetical protein NVS3B25_07490 [Hymenobacter sp.]
MPTINGENLVPLGHGGAAYVLGKTTPDALAIIAQGQRARELAAARAKALQDKADAERAKQYLDDSKYQQDGSVYFGKTLNDQVYQPLVGKLNEVYAKPGLDALGRAQLTRPLLQNTNNETVQSKAKTQYIKDTLAGFHKPLYDSAYATAHLTKNLPEGTLPSQFDEEAWKANLLGDHRLYDKKEVIAQATKGLLPTVTQRIEQAGALGGKHVVDQIKGQLLAFDDHKRPIFNADGTQKVALSANTQNLLESDPLFKLKLDAEEADYNKLREADPTLPVISRRGHIANMVGPLLHYDQAHDETLIRLHFASARTGRPSYTVNPVTSYEGGVTGADVVTGSTQTDQPVFVGGTGELTKPRMNQSVTPVMQQGFFSPVRRPQPTYATKSDPAKPFLLKGLAATEVIRPGKNGGLEVDANNKNGIFGYAQQGVTFFRNRKTGAIKIPPANEQDHNAQLHQLGKDWMMEAAVQSAVPVNKNYANEIGPVQERLASRERQKAAQNLGYVPKTSDELEAEAFKLASGGTETQYLPYNHRTAGNIDAQTAGAFREFATKVVPAAERKIRSQAGSTPKATGVNFSPATAPAPSKAGNTSKKNYKAAGDHTTGINWNK